MVALAMYYTMNIDCCLTLAQFVVIVIIHLLVLESLFAVMLYFI